MIVRAVSRGVVIVSAMAMAVLGSWANAGPSRQQRALLGQIDTNLKQINSTQLNFPGRYTPDLTAEQQLHGVDSQQIESWLSEYIVLYARLESDARSVPLAEMQLLADRTRAGSERLTQLLQFWSEWRVTSRRAKLWRSFLDINRITSPYDAEIVVLMERLTHERAAANFELARSSTVPALAALYEKGFREGQLQAWDVVREDRLEQARSQPCLDPPSLPMPGLVAKTGIGSPRPRIDPERSLNSDDFYPAAQRRSAIEGRVGLGVDVDERGCARNAIVQVSSGDLDLDAGALRYVVSGVVFHPLLVEGAVRAGRTRMIVQFELRN